MDSKIALVDDEVSFEVPVGAFKRKILEGFSIDDYLSYLIKEDPVWGAVYAEKQGWAQHDYLFKGGQKKSGFELTKEALLRHLRHKKALVTGEDYVILCRVDGGEEVVDKTIYNSFRGFILWEEFLVFLQKGLKEINERYPQNQFSWEFWGPSYPPITIRTPIETPKDLFDILHIEVGVSLKAYFMDDYFHIDGDALSTLFKKPK